jgi:hypothetical protein
LTASIARLPLSNPTMTSPRVFPPLFLVCSLFPTYTQRNTSLEGHGQPLRHRVLPEFLGTSFGASHLSSRGRPRPRRTMEGQARWQARTQHTPGTRISKAYGRAENAVKINRSRLGGLNLRCGRPHQGIQALTRDKILRRGQRSHSLCCTVMSSPWP